MTLLEEFIFFPFRLLGILRCNKDPLKNIIVRNCACPDHVVYTL